MGSGQQAAKLTRVAAMKELVADESFSEETRESAQKALDELAVAQIDREKRAAGVEQTKAEALLSEEESIAQLEAETKAEMMKWLASHRLARHAEAIAKVAGPDAAPSDLQFLTEDNIAEIGNAMTHIENMRLQAALQALSEETAASAE